MSLDVSIKYKDASRPEYRQPFSFQSTLENFWWPTAKKHKLETLQRLESLFIEDRPEAEQFVRELRFVENLLKAPDRGGASDRMADYLLDQLALLLPVFDQALAEWDNVEELSI